MFRQSSIQSLVSKATTPLVYQPRYNIRIRYPHPNTQIQIERTEYRKLLKQYRKTNIKEYWERQTMVENEHIESWNKFQKEKFQRDLIRERASVVRIAGATQRRIDDQRRREDRKLAVLENHRLNEETKKANRMQILQMLNFDSQTWFTRENIEQKMIGQVLVPDFVYNQTSYYTHLQELALLYESADFKGMEKLTMEADYIKQKNELLAPLYAELVNVIRDITYNEEAQYISDYIGLKNAVFQSKELTPEEKVEKINRLKKNYGELILKQKEESRTPSNRINELHRSLVCLHKLLQVWDSYITYLKMDRYQFEFIKDGATQQEDSNIIDPSQDIDKRDPLKAQDFDEAVTSANEKMTSESEHEIDVENNAFGEILDRTDKVDEFFKKFGKETEAQEEPAEVKKDADEFDFEDSTNLFETILSKNEESLAKKFEQEFAGAVDQERFLYGNWKEAVDVNEFLKENTVQSFIPEAEIEQARDFEKVNSRYAAYVETTKDEPIPDEENTNLLNSSALTTAYKKEVDELETKESLSRKEKTKLADIRKLLTKVEEIQVEEGRLLLKVFEMYKYNYKLE